MKTRLMVALVPLLLLPPTGCTSVKRFLYEGFGRDGWQKPDEVKSFQVFARDEPAQPAG